MRRAAVLVALVLSLTTFLLVDVIGTTAASAAPQVHTVLIEGMRFQPEGLSISAGDTVVWINRDMVPHTATSAGHFDSSEIPPGKSWTYSVRDTGELDYICTYHPLMKGVLRVR